MDMDIRFARDKDDAPVSFSLFGEGPPLLLLGKTVDYLKQVSAAGKFYERLAGRRTIALQELDYTLSLDQWVDQAMAVVDAAEFGEFAVMADYRNAGYAIEIAASMTGRVTAAVFWSGVANGAEFSETPRAQAIYGLAEADWELYLEMFATNTAGRDGPRENARQFVTYIRSHFSSAELLKALENLDQVDVRLSMSKVLAPVLLVHRRNASVPTLEQIQSLAGNLPNATLRVFDGDGQYPEFGDQDEAFNAIEGFLNTHQPWDDASPDAQPRAGLQIIMFTDLESSTALTQKVGDEAAQEVLHGHNDAVRKSLKDNGGREVKHTGDGIMAAFPSAVRAVEAALQIQRDLAGGEVRVRIGLNAGEPIAEDDDFFGTAVQLAARVCDRAEPGQVLVSRVVADLCAGKKLKFQPTDEAHMKGFAEPVALFEVSV